MDLRDRYIGGLRRDAASEALRRAALFAVMQIALIVAGALMWDGIYEDRPPRAVILLLIAPALLWGVMTQLATVFGLAVVLLRNTPPLRVRDGRLIYLNTWVLDVPIASIRAIDHERHRAHDSIRGLRLDVKGRWFPTWIPSEPIDATLDDIRAALGLSA